MSREASDIGQATAPGTTSSPLLIPSRQEVCSEVVPHMPCINEPIGAIARQEPSTFDTVPYLIHGCWTTWPWALKRLFGFRKRFLTDFFTSSGCSTLIGLNEQLTCSHSNQQKLHNWELLRTFPPAYKWTLPQKEAHIETVPTQNSDFMYELRRKPYQMIPFRYRSTKKRQFLSERCNCLRILSLTLNGKWFENYNSIWCRWWR